MTLRTTTIMIITLLFMACSAPQETPVNDQVIQTAIAATGAAQPTQALEPTQTPAPPSPTPTTEPSATPTQSYYLYTSTDVIAAFKADNLEIGETREMTPDDYGMAPLVAVEGTRFTIPSLCEDCGGRVMSFESPDDLEAIQMYYEELGRSSAIFFSWVFVRDNILVQINGDLPEEQATAYESALNNLD